MCLFCENYEYCITSIEKNQVDVLCAVGELSAKEKHFVCSKPSEFSREAEGITGDQEGITGVRKAAGSCLSFAPVPLL